LSKPPPSQKKILKKEDGRTISRVLSTYIYVYNKEAAICLAVFENTALSGLPGKMVWGRTAPSPEIPAIPPYLALRRIGLACTRFTGPVGSYPAISRLTPFSYIYILYIYNVYTKKERSSLCGAFRTLAGPAVTRYPVLRRPDFPLQHA